MVANNNLQFTTLAVIGRADLILSDFPISKANQSESWVGLALQTGSRLQVTC